MSRPDYVHCVLLGMASLAKESNKTWCGRELSVQKEKDDYPTATSELAFRSPTHALLNARNMGRDLVCPECSAKMVETLKAGTHDP